MAEVIGLKAILDDSNFQAGMKRYNSGLQGMNDNTSRTANSATAGMSQIGGAVLGVGAALGTAVVGGAVLAAGAVAAFTVKGVSSAIAMEQQVANIAAVLNISSDEAGVLKGVISDLAIDPRFKVTAQEAGSAMEMLARNGVFAGVSVDDYESVARGATEATILLANATGAEYGTAADIATDAMALFGIEATDMTDTVSGIISVTTNSKFTIQDYADALKMGGAAAADMKVSTTDFNAVIAASAEELGNGQRAGTSFATFLRFLTPTSAKAKTEMESLGLIVDGNNAFFDDATGELKSMSEVSEILQGSIGDLTDIERSNALETIFGAKATGTALALIKEGEVVYTDAAIAADGLGVSQEKVNEFIEGGITGFEAFLLTMSETDALRASATRVDTVSGAIEIFKSLVGGVSLQIGDVFLPMIRKLIDAAIDLVDKYGGDVIAAFQAFADIVSDVMGSLPELIEFFKALITGNGDLLGSFVALPASIRPAVQAIWQFMAPVIRFVKDHADAFIGAFKGLAAVLGGGVIVSVLTAIGAVLATIFSPIGLLIAAIIGLSIAWETNFLGMRDILTAFWFDQAKPALEELWAWLQVNVPIALETLRAMWVDTVWPAIQQAIEIVWPIILAIFDAYVFYITDILIPTLVSLWEYWVNTLWPAIQSAIEFAWPIIQAILTEMWNVLVNIIIPTLIQLWAYWVETLWPAIQQAVVTAWEFILPILTSMWVWFTETLIPTLVELWTYWVTILWPAISTAVTNAWEIISLIFEAIVLIITDVIIPKILEFQEQWITVWTAIQSIIESFGILFGEIAAEIGRWINDNIVPWIEEFQAIWEVVWEAVKLAIGLALDAIKEKFDEVWDAIKDKVQEVWDQLKPIFETIEKWMKETLGNAATTLQGVWAGVWDAMTGKVDAAKTTVQGIIDAIEGFASWLSTAVFDFEIGIPDLPDWALPGSPLPIHTAWKNYHEWTRANPVEQAVSINAEVEPLTQSTNTGSIVDESITTSTVNEFNLSMATQESEPSLRQTFKLMELMGT